MSKPVADWEISGPPTSGAAPVSGIAGGGAAAAGADPLLNCLGDLEVEIVEPVQAVTVDGGAIDGLHDGDDVVDRLGDG